MTFKSMLAACSLMLLFICGTSNATVLVEYRTYTGSFGTVADATVQPGTNNVTIPNPAAGVYRVYSNTPTTDSIGLIKFSGTAGSTFVLLVGNANDKDPNTALPVACVNWAGLTSNGNYIVLQASIGGSLTGSITTDQIVRLDVGGTIEAAATVTHIPSNTTNPPSIVKVTVGGGLYGTILALWGNIVSVECTNDITGVVESRNGDIDSVICRDLAGTIQVLADHAQITAVTVNRNMISPAIVYAANGSIGPGRGRVLRPRQGWRKPADRSDLPPRRR